MSSRMDGNVYAVAVEPDGGKRKMHHGATESTEK